MKRILLKDDYDKALKLASETIKSGGLVICPTDTVYILAVDPTNKTAVDKLISFKDRWPGKAISVAVENQEMADKYVKLDERVKTIMDNLLPGPFTLVVDGRHKTAKGIEAEDGTLGIRIPDNEWIADLVKTVNGPITATSANLSGRTPHYSVDSLVKTLSNKKIDLIDLVIDGGKLARNKPSTVVDISKPEIKVLRRGDLMTGEGKVLISKSEKETEKIARFIFNRVSASETPTLKPMVFLLSGDLGCGKTVFSRAVGKLLGVKENITSPTFFIENEYKVNFKLRITNFKFEKFLHFDLYKIEGKNELEEIKFLDQFKTGIVACIEWPENMGKEMLLKLREKTNYFGIYFEYKDETTREIKVV